MKKLFDASFEQVEPGISESFIENTIDTARSFRGLKAIGFFLIFGFFAPFVLFVLGYIIENDMENSVVKLDVTNEFIGLFSNGYIYVVFFISFILTMGTLLFYRSKNRPKGTYIYNAFFGLYVMICLIVSFKFGQLFVTTFALRVIYTIFFIFTFFYAFRISFIQAKELACGTAKHRHFFIEWVSRNSKRIIPVLLMIGGAYYTYKVFSLEGANLEQRIMGNLAFIFPFIIALANFVYVYCCDVFFRGYYVSKYSEEFRKKYEYTREEWYGPNYKRQ